MLRRNLCPSGHHNIYKLDVPHAQAKIILNRALSVGRSFVMGCAKLLQDTREYVTSNSPSLVVQQLKKKKSSWIVASVGPAKIRHQLDSAQLAQLIVSVIGVLPARTAFHQKMIRHQHAQQIWIMRGRAQWKPILKMWSRRKRLRHVVRHLGDANLTVKAQSNQCARLIGLTWVMQSVRLHPITKCQIAHRCRVSVDGMPT